MASIIDMDLLNEIINNSKEIPLKTYQVATSDDSELVKYIANLENELKQQKSLNFQLKEQLSIAQKEYERKIDKIKSKYTKKAKKLSLEKHEFVDFFYRKYVDNDRG